MFLEYHNLYSRKPSIFGSGLKLRLLTPIFHFQVKDKAVKDLG